MSRRNNHLPFLVGIAAGIYTISRLLRRQRLQERSDYFQGKIVLITGASRGIGRELAHAFARRGASLVLASRNLEQLQAVAVECRATNREIGALVVQADVTDEAQLENLVNTALAHFGYIDILVNNAGIIQGGGFVDVGPESVQQVMEVNLMSAMRLTQLVLPSMIERGAGVIVNMVSASGRHAMPYYVAYSASKHSMIGFSDGLRRELAGIGVQVLTVNPGYTQTDIVEVAQEAYRKMGFKMIPPEVVARRTLEGIVLEEIEVNVGFVEYVAGWLSKTMPRVADLYWRYFVPRDFGEIVSGQWTE